jgi:DNA repair exonuclease SbcCD nuclease subunit
MIFLHSADWQLGKSFATVLDPQKRALLQQERFAVIRTIGDVAKSVRAEFLLVAGDLFDSPRPAQSTVSAACAAIGAMALPVIAIPGNHDHAGVESIWNQPFFAHEKQALAPNLIVLASATPCDLPGAVLLPCPALRRHESEDATNWLRSVDFEGFGEKPRIVLAHGHVRGFSMREEVSDDGEMTPRGLNRIDLSRLPQDELDYIALGDWHGAKQVGAKAWYSGTPEPDRFPRGESNDPGKILLVEAERGRPPVVTMRETARIGWHRLEFEFSDGTDLARLERRVEELVGLRAQLDALALELCGSLGIEARTKLEEKLAAWDARLLRLQLVDRTVMMPAADELATLMRRATDPLIARVAAKLVALSEGDGEQTEVARIALRELHAACREI